MNDAGHKETEAIIKGLEKKVTKEYAQASKEIQAKLDKYFKRFETKDNAWRQMVKDGKKTADEYAEWRTGQLLVGRRWATMRDTIAEDLHNTNLIARGMIAGRMPETYAINHNWGTFDVERAGRVDTSYTLYNRDTVERLLRDEPDLLKPPGPQMQKTFADWDTYINTGSDSHITPETKKAFDKLLAQGKDIRWQKGQIQSVVTQSILQGESIPNMARRIARTMGEMNQKASIRYARTAMTSAQNAGRRDAFKRAQDMGINLQQEWIATLDNRTRHAHRQLDGQIVAIDEPFHVDGYDILYPGDPTVPGYLVYNCRCTTAAKVSGWVSMSGQLRSDQAIAGQTYEEWKQGHSYAAGTPKPPKTPKNPQPAQPKPAPTPEPKPKPVFTPAKTKAEAAQYAKQFADSVDFGRLTLAECNAINEQLLYLTDKYPINKLARITPRAGQAVMSASGRSLNISPTNIKSLATAHDRHLQNQEQIRKTITFIKKGYPDGNVPASMQSTITKLENKLKFTRFGVDESYADHIATCVTHEYGHIISDQYFGMINNGLANPNYFKDPALPNQVKKVRDVFAEAKKTGDIYNLSEYGSTDADEFFAEAFAAYDKGEALPGYIKDMFDEVLRNGIL